MNEVSDAGIYLPAKALGDQLAVELKRACARFWPTGYTQRQFQKYAQRVQLPGEEAETFYLDGVPMLRIHPIRSVVVGRKLRMTRTVERLY